MPCSLPSHVLWFIWYLYYAQAQGTGRLSMVGFRRPAAEWPPPPPLSSPSSATSTYYGLALADNCIRTWRYCHGLPMRIRDWLEWLLQNVQCVPVLSTTLSQITLPAYKHLPASQPD